MSPRIPGLIRIKPIGRDICFATSIAIQKIMYILDGLRLRHQLP
jgi:hypothetical protein